MLKNGHQHPNLFHLAGIVPVAAQRMDFGMDWSDCLMPLAKNLTAVENAALECAWAGCETIWIVCNDDVSPLIRYRIGDYLMDPVYFNRFDVHPSNNKRRIPVFYVPLHHRDRQRRDCLAWSVVHGAARCFSVCSRLSSQLSPRKYYVSFPHGVYRADFLRGQRKAVSSVNPFFLTHQGESIRTGAQLGFTFDAEDWKTFRDILKLRREDLIKSELLEKKNAASHFTLDMVFKNGIVENTVEAEVPWYYPIDSWDSYCSFLGSEERKELARPGPHILKYREYNRIGYEPDD